MTVTPSSARLEALGETVQLAAEVRDQNGAAMNGVTVVWTSDASAVATVDPTGLVAAIGDGTATITAASGELSAAATVTVETPPPVAASLTISPASARLGASGEAVQFTATVKDQDGNLLTGVATAWSSDAPSVATVSAAGLVTAVGAGTAVVTASAGEVTASATVTVETPTDESTGSSLDREALIALYESTGGEDWVNSSNWLSEKPVADWHGVYTDHDGRVNAIALFDNGLAGPIPPEIENLTALTELHLSSNRLSGSIPAELAKLENLERLSLFNNSLSGPVPGEIGNLARLKTLELSNSGLSGPIPPELGALANLVRLRLARNDLTGPIPRELGGLARLQDLNLTANDLSGAIPSELGAALQLSDLSIAQNRLSGPIPPELGKLANLRQLRINGNELSGALPQELTRLSLTTFWWGGNPGLCMPDTVALVDWVRTIGDHYAGRHCNLSERAVLEALYGAAGGSGWTNKNGWPDGPVTSRYGVRVDAAGRVIAIDLSDNGLAGELPLELGNLMALEELRLGGNPNLAGRLPYTLPRLETLTELRYAGTGLCVPNESFVREWLDAVAVHEGTGQDCAPTPDREVLEKLHEAMGGERWFDATNWLSDAPLREWHGVDTDGQGRVTRLGLIHNGLDGAIPPDIVALEKLTELRLHAFDSRNSAIPPELGELANLTVLEIVGIHASGSIPPQLGKLTRLTTLKLNNNGLTGPIPPELGNLAALARLQLDDNRLTGSIPLQLANAAELEEIHLANNDLSGTIPTSLAVLDKLSILDLSGNSLSDYLPSSFGDFVRLEYLNLSYNDLFGPIPAELGRLGSLTDLYLGSNSLSGSVPPELAGLSQLRSLALTGNADLTGPLPQELAELRELEHLQAIGTKLCAPHDAALQSWLNGLITRRVRQCGVEPVAAYLTQAIQSRELPIALVAGKEALLRVFPTAAQANAERMPAIRAEFYLGGTLAHSVNVDSAQGPIPTELDEGSLDRSVNATVPAEFVQPGLEMVIEIDPGRTLDAGLGVANRIPQTGRVAVEVRAMPRFDITFIPFLWETNPDMSAVELTNAMAADPEGHEMLRLVRALLPVGEISVNAHAPVRTASNAAHILFDETRLIQTMESGSGYYMGLLAGEVEGASGIADLGHPVSFSVTNASVIAHELGHNLSLQHAPCGGPLGIDPAYPYDEASTGHWGWDIVERRLVSPQEHFDLMAYCGPPWISDFSFDRMLRYRLHGAGRLRSPEAGAGAEPVASLLIWGGVDPGSSPYLEPAFVTKAPPTLPRSSGPWRIAGASGDGTVLFDLSFAMPETVHGDGRSGFAFALPVQAGWPESLVSITLTGPPGSFTLDADAGPPVTILRDGPAGQVIGIAREPEAAEALRTLTEPGLYSRGIPEAGDWSR